MTHTMSKQPDNTQASRITALYTAFMRPDKDNDGSLVDTFTVTRIGLEYIANAITAHTNKRIEEVLDRLESMAAYDPSGSPPVISPRQIEAERNKLKESK